MGFLKSLFGGGQAKVNIRTRFEMLRDAAISGTMSSFHMARDRKSGEVVGLKILDIKKTKQLEDRFVGLHKPREGEIALAQKNALPKLVKLSDVRGDLHVHSNWRVADVLAEMAQAGRRRGCEYMALTDHSLRVTVAHGLNRARVLRQIKEVDRPNAKMDGFTVLKGVEVDILADGELDMPDEVLSRLDVIGAAVHYKFDLPREKADGADSARAV